MSSSFRKLTLLFFVVAFATFFCIASIETQAQTVPPFKNDAEGMTLSPPSFEMTLKPGEETAYTIQITNPTKNLVELYPSAGNFTASGDDGQPKYEIGELAVENDSRFSIASWVSFTTPKVAILPEQVVDFRFFIKIPEDAEPGGHYGVVFLGTKPPAEKDPDAQVALSTMVGSLLLVRVPGDIREDMTIDEFSTPWFYFTPPVDLNTFLRNKGNVHVKPQGEVTITNWRGEDIARIDINPKKGNILPESRRKFNVAWKPEISPFWKIPIGKFHATLKATYGQSNKDISQDIEFWIIPKWFIITVSVFIALLILLITIFFIRRGRKKRKQQKLNGKNPPSWPTYQTKTRNNQPTTNYQQTVNEYPVFPTRDLLTENERWTKQNDARMEDERWHEQEKSAGHIQNIRFEPRNPETLLYQPSLPYQFSSPETQRKTPPIARKKIRV